MQKKIYLIRHTKPAIERGYIYGQTDLDVDTTFEQEAAAVLQTVPALKDMPLYSSPLQRCYKLAKYLGGKSLVTDDRIKEINFGEWEMKRWKDMDEQTMKSWMTNLIHQKPPGGESNAEVSLRAVDFWKEVIQKEAPEIGIVCHYGIILSMLSHLLEIQMDKVFRMDLNYGTIIRVTIFDEERYKILFLK